MYRHPSKREKNVSIFGRIICGDHRFTSNNCNINELKGVLKNQEVPYKMGTIQIINNLFDHGLRF